MPVSEDGIPREFEFFRVHFCSGNSMVSHFMQIIAERFSITNVIYVQSLKDITVAPLLHYTVFLNQILITLNSLVVLL